MSPDAKKPPRCGPASKEEARSAASAGPVRGEGVPLQVRWSAAARIAEGERRDMLVFCSAKLVHARRITVGQS